MLPTTDHVLVLYPGALGDCLCFLPTLAALRRVHAGRMCLVAQPAFLDLLGWSDTTKVSIQRREIADLFSTSSGVAPETAALFGGFTHVYSWTGFGDVNFARRLTRASGGHVDVYPFRGMRAGEHAVDYYSRCVALEPAPPGPAAGVFSMDRSRWSLRTAKSDGLLGRSLAAPIDQRECPTERTPDAGPIVEDDPRWFTEFAERHGLITRGFILVHTGSGAREKNWEGFDAVARQWRQQHREAIVVPLGPAEMERRPAPIAGAIVVDRLSLTQVAALLRRCRLYLGNDSGISHLAGVVGARGVVVFGPTDPAVWGPRREGLEALYAPDGCTRCGAQRFCTHRLAVETVIAALESPESIER